ncbi:guanine nucleotide-binding protein-like 3 isoform X3 [Molossus molossus]|uniref:Guanine nucleotide-binding protein-like 3 n=1 Tax=Molossus molossus TaxID=27622 RepID=A0A7J8DB81_MOLMO|nr:guanine nucleotide-binding protein-like 3 isoform X3 [Molossus molossus]KAF6420388.1 G protein nucleolar 3 [Molossus molossus]
MKRPKLKKASKRMTCHKRYKIQKKVREHHRKLRKEAKKWGRKKPRKDPGVPNSAPFKEDLLREAELRKQRLEELKQQQKLDRQKEQEKKRKLEINPGVEPSNMEPVKEESGQCKTKLGKQNPKKLYCQELKKVIEASDVVLEVLDARDPLGCRCPQVEEAIVQGGQKKLVLVLNKSDLVPKENLENWLNYLKKELPTVVFRASTNLKDKRKIIKMRRKTPLKSEVCIGKEGLWKLLGGFQETYGKAIQVGVIGFPNVGKSSIINSLKQEQICNVGVSMGLTRNMQVVPLSKHITIIDSPSFIVSPLNSPTALALRSPASIEVLKPVEAASAILSQADTRQVILKFTVPDFKNSLEFFTLLAQRRGLHQKGGSPNVDGAAKLLWSEWTGGSLGYYCHPPTFWTLSPHFNENTVTDMKWGFNLEELEKNNAHSIQTIRGPRLACSILFQSSGLTNGIIEERDIPELPKQKENKQEEGEDYEDIDSDQDSVDEDDGEKSLDMSSANETCDALLDESQADEQCAQSYVLDGMSKEEDDAYDFSTDYV